MGKSISVKKRWEVVFLATHRLGPKLPIRRISKELRCSIGAVQHWLKVYKETGEVEEIPRTGRRKITGPKENEIIKNLILSNPETTAEQISNALKSMGTSASPSTVRRRLSDLGMAYIRPINKPLLSKKHCIERVKFGRRNKFTD